SIGVSYNSDHGLLYVNFGTSFETPTTTELVNHPEMTGGFNPDIKPEIARGVETGFRGMWPQSLLRYEIAVFRMQVKDQLISFRTPEGGSRDFYRNAGKTRHDGLEASVRWKANHWLEMLLNYNYSHFTFLESDGSDFEEGNRLPGIPEHRLVAGVSFQHSGFRTDLTFEHTGSYYVNNENTTSNPGYELVHVRMGHSGFDLADTARWIPFIAINNVFDTQYNSSVSVNANFGRYYEPAPGRSVFLGWTLEW
ncbi:TonB-dependent receptor, partial [Balneolaceae bacterium ANBcel3]|nr:TonB-dependent receptor [Balneolaceae bacterium ANBcel3]